MIHLGWLPSFKLRLRVHIQKHGVIRVRVWADLGDWVSRRVSAQCLVGTLAVALLTPEEPPEVNVCATLKSYRWRGHCRGLFHTPIAA
jgi:hypothetical protein